MAIVLVLFAGSEMTDNGFSAVLSSFVCLAISRGLEQVDVACHTLGLGWGYVRWFGAVCFGPGR